MEVRKVRREEYLLLVSFLKNYWKKDHALVKSKQLLDFQHLDGDNYNFYAAIEDNEIYALEGFIKASLYDKSLTDEDDMWGAIWKSRPDAQKGEAGLWVKEALSEKEKKQSWGGIGLSEMAYKINKMMRFTMGYLHHYYIANREIDNFKVGANLFVDRSSHERNDEWTIKQNIRLDSVIEPTETYRPRKTLTYLVNRYQYHPIYKSIFWGIYHNEELVSIWTLRRQIVDGTSILRVIDVLGRIDNLPDLTENFQDILSEESCEYIDFSNYGIRPEVFKSIGFTELGFEDESVIVPTYFEPFERRNVKITLSYKAKYEEYVAFKGDADQDRPNVL